MKTYIKSLFPFRFILLVIFIALMWLIILIGAGAELELMKQGRLLSEVIFYGFEFYWLLGIIFFIFVVDIVAGIGREGITFKVK